MKQFRFIGAVAILLLAMAAPSTSMAKMYNSERLDHWLNDHPGVRSKLAANPNLIYNKDFREDHPELRTFLQNHPDVWDKIGRGPGMAGGPRGWGDYDERHEWHDADWWHSNDRAWMYRHHPEWVENHPDWRRDDGDFDDAHVWHDRDWWNENHRDWVERRHPDWDRDKDAWKDWKEQKHAQHEAFKDQEHAQHEAYKDQEHAEHKAYKAEEHAEHKAYKADEHAEHEAYKAQHHHDKN
jgi:hypothetical protein